jgi:hypothetical protein
MWKITGLMISSILKDLTRSQPLQPLPDPLPLAARKDTRLRLRICDMMLQRMISRFANSSKSHFESHNGRNPGTDFFNICILGTFRTARICYLRNYQV